MKLIAYTKEITWMSMVAHGWGNGYVAVPQEHPLYCKDYDDAALDHIDVHGGLTFSALADDPDYFPENVIGMWVFGFDTIHSADTLTRWPDSDSVMREALRLKAQLEAITE